MSVKQLLVTMVCGLSGLLMLAGCGRSPQTSFYALTPLVTEVTAPKLEGPSIAIASVTLPELVDRPQLVVPDAGTRVAILESHRWAEPLKSAIPRLLAENISRLMNSARISAYPQHAANSTDYRLFVDFQRFELLGSRVVVDALWEIRSAKGAKSLTGRAKLLEPIGSTDHEAVVAGYSRALATLSKEIAQSLRNLQTKE
ncbi:membrane integrity-associated transporter subunit PqiC [Trichlorobacter lovleyi]|uniref:PqiC family protein n=1 Tax=Trichlorobacter lovleyi TaxID=313985 RepID=UPI002240A455|nr:PqiC family protein [Trichlorobacter lovleyi]QOX80222.1 membrane integrity-associated transporter subunit PqiC [Trichlorobacter lovleyi]